MTSIGDVHAIIKTTISCLAYYQDVKNAAKEIAELSAQAQTLRSTLKKLSTDTSELDDETKDCIGDIVEGITKNLNKINQYLKPGSRFWCRMSWSWNKKGIKDAFEATNFLNGQLNAILAGHTTRVVVQLGGAEQGEFNMDVESLREMTGRRRWREALIFAPFSRLTLTFRDQA